MIRWILYTRRFDKLTGELPIRSYKEAIYQGNWTYAQIWRIARKDYPWFHSSSMRIERDAS